jgi:2-C-methyl-D-erythritol 4-phosphate cytidylyltransferase
MLGSAAPAGRAGDDDRPHGRSLVEWSIAALRAAPAVRTIVVACPPRGSRASEHGSAGTNPAAGSGGVWEGVSTVEGGATRSQSVANALEAVGTELVAIHDAARPLVTPELVEGVVATLVADPEADGAIAATPVTDTIKRIAGTIGRADPGVPAAMKIAETVDRDALWAAQTPQVFRTEALRRALGADPAQVEAATDEAMLVEAAGGRVLIHPSSPENLKVTTPLDLRVAELLLRA